MKPSHLPKTLDSLSRKAATAMVARGRLASPGLNSALLRRLSDVPGSADGVLADPVYEAAQAWQTAEATFGDLSGNILHPRLVGALDGADRERMPRDRHPYRHQVEAWAASLDGRSCLVSAGTGSGKTECFMVPMLSDLLSDEAKGRLTGVRAIIVYPLNALIESQRERLSAWTEPLKDRLSFALYNGMTPHRPRQVDRARLAAAEVGDRKAIRETPPSILVTNVTMLEYMLLRTEDRPILERSQGLLRWIVLDEAHSYIGAQAAEMALLLRRVRAAFGVAPEAVRLMATSATISDGGDTEDKLSSFLGDLAGMAPDRTKVIQGRTTDPVLPAEGSDQALDPAVLENLDATALWHTLAPHPRIRKVRQKLSEGGLCLGEAAKILFGAMDAEARGRAQLVLDAGAQACCPETGQRFLPWRAHLFHRAQGGLWACIDPECPHRDPELARSESGWSFGALHLTQRDHCLDGCRAPVFEVEACTECGTPHLIAGYDAGARPRLMPRGLIDFDDFSIDAEPAEAEQPERRPHIAWLAPAQGGADDRFVADDGDAWAIYDNAPPRDRSHIRIALYDEPGARLCCPEAETARLQPQRYGPPFFMGTALPGLVEALAPPQDAPGLPMGGRRALTFSDSRQGTARLAAKLQQEAERALTRSFLYHSVQQDTGPDPEERAKLERKLSKYEADDPEEWADEIANIRRKLGNSGEPLPWRDLVQRFADQPELRDFAAEVWAPRLRGGQEMADDPAKLAEMLLFRELFRRPKVQNNAETMGLVRLSFPRLEFKARSSVPRVWIDAGLGVEDWVGLALSAVDFRFRQNLAVKLPSSTMAQWINPRAPGQRSVYPASTRRSEITEQQPLFWPSSQPHSDRPSRLHRMIYTLLGADYDDPVDQDRAGEALDALWALITTTAATETGGGAWSLSFEKAAVVRLDKGWLCPVTRRVFGYAAGGRSPYDPRKAMPEVELPRLPQANPGGVTQDTREMLKHWCETDSTVAHLREYGLWTDLHDRVATYAPFLRAQEHSAQIPRAVLETYETAFKTGRINLLNCSTTMEMGVDIPDVRLVVNANVPPSISNYRQRSGRAGRRSEAWAFTMTFCRDLPLDHMVFQKPELLLESPIAAPAVRLDSPGLVQRHVNAMLMASWLADEHVSFNIQMSCGAFFGVADDATQPQVADVPVHAFLDALRGSWARDATVAERVRTLTRGTVLDGVAVSGLAARTADTLEDLLDRWQREYSELLSRAAAANDRDGQYAFELRAKRMRGEFLLSELAKRGFTPAYGFPVDVVSFDHLRGRESREVASQFGEGRRGDGTSRTLDVALREYAPGAEVVVDGLVHQSEGIMPAWGAGVDASKLEDLRALWECSECHGFGLAQFSPETCPNCGTPEPRQRRSLRPAGFIGRKRPHTGYENLGHVPFEPPRVSAAGGVWTALPDHEAGRIRADTSGTVITLSSGTNGAGYAICLACGRAVAEADETPGAALPDALRRHRALAPGRGLKLVDGHCPGGYTEPHRVQRNVRLVHEATTDVFETQLPTEATRASAGALAAGMREALAARLGVEAREIGVAAGASRGPSGDARMSLFLHDRAAGGAGLSSRLEDQEWFAEALKKADAEILNCPEACEEGCPACIMRPDLGLGSARLDRPGAKTLAEALLSRLDLPERLRIFGADTRILGTEALAWLEHHRRTGRLTEVTLYMHGLPSEGGWDLGGWPVDGLFSRLASDGLRARIVGSSTLFTDRAFDLGRKLALYRLAAHADLAHMPEMPFAGGMPVLAAVKTLDGPLAIVATDLADSAPGPEWGSGSTAPLVRGAMENAPSRGDRINVERLIEFSGGNAQLVQLGIDVEGPVKGFGARFWKRLAGAAPLTVQAAQSVGIARLEYSDRYLLTPLNLRLLLEVIGAAPGKRPQSTAIHVISATYDGRPSRARSVFDAYDEDAMRREVATRLIPDARIDIRAKPEVSHERRLTLLLQDERRIEVLLDQGFGAWRAVGKTRHDFSAAPEAQARTIQQLSCIVSSDCERGTPAIVYAGATS